MDPQPPDNLPILTRETPEALLLAFRDHPEWTQRQRDEHLERLIARVRPEHLPALIVDRLGDLGGTEGEVLLRLVEAQATPELLHELAKALVAQPDLAPERAWEALALLEGAGVLDTYPELAELRDEFDEELDEGGSLDLLAEQLEGDPEGTWLALQGIGAIEPEIRPQIVEGLAAVPLGPGLIAFLRLLGFAHDPATRASALDVLEGHGRDDPGLVAAWAALAADHPDAEVVARARRWLGASADTAISTLAEVARPAPRLVRCLVTALDGRGQGQVILSASRGGTRATAAFLCDMGRGIPEVAGRAVPEAAAADDDLDGLAATAGLDVVEGAGELALGLLGGSLMLCGPETSPALRYWLEETAPPGFRARPFPDPYPGWDPWSLPFEEMPARAQAVLDACPTWIDDSPLTYEIAEEIVLREGDVTPDPRRDSGAYRYLFEHRLTGQLELYRRMLFWMASVWRAADDDERGRSALALAVQLSDAQHAVPGHPFTVALMTRSLSAAQAHLREGIDPRRPTSRPGA